MIINLIGFLLVLVISAHVLVIVGLYRQRIAPFFVPLYIYLNILMIGIEVSTLFFLQTSMSGILPVVFDVRLIIEAFVPPILIALNQAYNSGNVWPKIKLKNLIFWGISLLIAVLVLDGKMIEGAVSKNAIIYPNYGKLYVLFLVYFYFCIIYIFVDFLRNNRSVKPDSEARQIKKLIVLIIPVFLILFSVLHLSPYFGFIHPVLLISYPILSVLLIFMAFKFHLFEYDERSVNAISFFLVSLFFLVIFSFTSMRFQSWIFILLIPLLLLIFKFYQTIQFYIGRTLHSQNSSEMYHLEEELETLFTETGKYVDNQALAQFLGEYAQNVLRCSKCAVITSQFDIHPYQILYLKGLSKENIEPILTTANSPLLEKLELERKLLNKFDHLPQSNIYQNMESNQLYLMIPLVSQSTLEGFIFLGGERRFTRFLKKDLEFIKFLSLSAANAFHNIQSIQTAVQTQKMADLGIMASQLAHDFQSFITLVKLDTSGENRLRQRADYMEKLVRDLLNFAQPKDLQLTMVNINELIDMTLDVIKIPDNVLLERHYSQSIPQINIDLDQMRRVFLNLFENSINAMADKGGRLKITTRPLRLLSPMRRNTWMYIEIFDEGKGIPEEFLERIFDPFFTTRKNEGGNGLGLAIVKQIIGRHKGFIDVTSKLSKGTIFNIRLPYII